MGYRRRVYLPIPVLLRLALKSEDQDRGGISHVSRW
jgi:hypothetical protein